jgi:hypothetical protein
MSKSFPEKEFESTNKEKKRRGTFNRDFFNLTRDYFMIVNRVAGHVPFCAEILETYGTILLLQNELDMLKAKKNLPGEDFHRE